MQDNRTDGGYKEFCVHKTMNDLIQEKLRKYGNGNDGRRQKY